MILSRPSRRPALTCLYSKIGALGLAVTAVLTGPIQAANINWSGATDQNWDVSGNWGGGILPGAGDIAVMNVNAARNIYLNNTTQTIQGILFNQAVAYQIQGGPATANSGTGALILGQVNQTGNASNLIGANVTITTPNGGLDVLSSNVTQNTLQLQGQITSGGLNKTGNGLLRLGTSGTAFNNAINGAINLSGGTLQVAAGATAGVNNPLGGTGVSSNLINIGASGVTLQLTAQASYDFGREIVANNNSFTLRGDVAAADLGDFQMTIGKISIGNATLTAATGGGYSLRTKEVSLSSGATTTIATNNFLLVEALTGDATTKIVKTGGSDLRILANANNATTFAGDIDVNQGWLVLEGNGGGQPLGNAATSINIINAITTPTVSMRSDAAQTFTGVNINAGNNNFNLDVRNLTSGTNGFTMTGGTVSIGNATMNVTGDRAQARLAGISVDPGATLTTVNVNSFTNAAQNLTIDSLSGGGAGSVLRKTGGQTLTISPSSGGYAGNLELTGGTTNIQAAPGSVPTANVGTITLNNSNNFNLRSNTSVDFVASIVLGPNIKNQTLSADRISAGSNQQLRVGTIDISPGTLGERNVSLNSGNGFTWATDGIITNGNATLTVNTDTTSDTLTTGVGTTLTKRGGANLIVGTNNLATSAATLDIRAGTLTGNVAGAFGTGTVFVGNPVAASTGFYTDFSRVNWSAQGAGQATSGPDVVVRQGGALDLNVVPSATDVFEVQSFGRIQGTTAQLQALTLGGNVTLASDSIVVHENPSSTAGNTISGLPADASLWYGLAANAASLPTIGVGTPWKGISGENSNPRNIQGPDLVTPAVINIAGGDNDAATVEAYLMAMNDVVLNIGATGFGASWNSTAAGGEKVTLGIRGVMGTSGLGLVPGGRVLFQLPAADTNLASEVDQIIVENGSLGIIAANGLGGVPVEVRNGGSLDIGGVTGTVLDGSVTIKSGGALFLNDSPVLGNAATTDEGAITIEGGGKLDIGGSAPANIFSGSAANGQQINFTGSGHTVRFAASNIEGHTAITSMDSVVPDAGVTYVVAGGATAATVPETNLSITTNTQTAGLTIENGTLTNDGTSRAFTGPLTLNDTNLTVAASRNTSFIVTSSVNTAGDVQIGSLSAVDGRDKSNNSTATNWAGVQDPFNSGAQVIFTGPFAADDVNVQNSQLGFANANTTINGNLTISGGVLYLDGGGAIVGTQGELTPKLQAGNLADAIIMGQNARVEMKLALGSAGARLSIDQAFVIGGDINPQDNRTLYVSRSAGTDTGVNFNNITLLNGATFGVQEDNTDVRANIKLAGNAISSTTNSNNSIDYLGLTRDASLPAFDGTNPVVLQQGRLNMNGWQSSNTTNSSVFGTIGAGVQVDLIRGQLFFQPGSTLNGLVRTQTAPVGGDAFVLATSNGAATDSTIGGTGRIELGRSAAANGPEDLEIRGTEIASGTSPLTTLGALVRVVDDGAANVDGIIRSQRHNDLGSAARTALSNLEIANGATAQFSPQNSIPLTVTNTTLLGNATIDTTAGGVTFTTINAGANTLTLQGAAAPTITNSVTAANLVVKGLTTTVSLANVSGDLTVSANPGGTLGSGVAGTAANVTANGAVAGALSVDSSTANISANIGGGLNVTTGVVNFTGAGTKVVSGAVALDNSAVNVAGIVDFGTTTLVSTAPSVVAGLREQRSTGSFDLTTPNTSNVVKLGPVMAQTTAGWGTNETYTYTGEFFVPDNNGDGTGTFSFAENFDDSVRLVINGTQALNNAVFNVPTGTGAVTLNTGWYGFEARFGQGTGGAGPNTVATGAWDTSLGFGVDLAGPIDGSTTAPARANFVAPVDGGTMNVFRTKVQSHVNVAAASTVKAGGMSNVGTLAFNGNGAAVNLVANGSPNASSAETINVSGATTGSTLNIAEAGDALSIVSLNLGTAATSLDVSGAGDLAVTGAGSGTGGLAMNSSGTLTVDGSITSPVSLVTGTLSGAGVYGGGIVAIGGTIAPGSGVEVLQTSTLAANNATTFAFDLGFPTVGSPAAGTDFDQIRVTADTLDLGGANLLLAINPLNAGTDVFTLILNSGADTDPGAFGGIANGDTFTVNGHQVTLSYFDDAATPGLELAGGNDVSVLVSIPEPASAILLLGGLGSLSALRRRRRA